MDVWVLNTDFEAVGIIDYYISLIWTERYAEAGDFELYLKSDSSVFDIVQQGYYLYLKDAKMTMIIEQIEIQTDVEDGNELIITGRSLESILDRRIIFPQTNLDGKLQNGIKQLLDENLISPSDTDRKIDLFTFDESTDTAITDLQLKAQYTGDNLYDTIVAICAAYNIGFRVQLGEDNKFHFSLYSGTDRSYDQEDNTYVVFSAKYDNLKSSNYLESDKNLKTVTIVAGEGEGTDRKTKTVESSVGAGSGMFRRELFTDARDLSTTTSSTETMSDEAYMAKLEQRGLEKLAETVSIITFEGEIENGQTFTFDKDYHIGDIVQLVNEYKREGTVRVTELVRSIDTSGIQYYPTFVSTFKATINIVGNPGDTITVSGTGYGYDILLDDTGTASIIVLATGDYTFTGKLTGVEKELSVSTYTLSYNIDCSFSATVKLRANPNLAATITSQTDTSVVYSGTTDANGDVTFDVYRIGVYDIYTIYYDNAHDDKNKTVVLSEDPASSETVNPDHKGNTYSPNTVYLANISSVSTKKVSDSSNDLYLYWAQPEMSDLYSGMVVYYSTTDTPEARGDDYGTLLEDGYGTLRYINESDKEQKLSFTASGLTVSSTEDTTYYFAAWPYIEVGGTKYYGPKKTTSYTYSID
jgi:hypothetical protein